MPRIFVVLCGVFHVFHSESLGHPRLYQCSCERLQTKCDNHGPWIAKPLERIGQHPKYLHSLARHRK